MLQLPAEFVLAVTLMPFEVKPLAVVVAALSGFMVGGLWYGPIFGKPWLAATGFTAEQLKRDGSPMRSYLTAFVANLIGAYALAAVLGADVGTMDGAFAGLFVGLAWVATAFATSYAFENRGMPLLMINAGYQVVALMVTGAVIGLLQ